MGICESVHVHKQQLASPFQSWDTRSQHLSVTLK